ncbi:MAG: leucine-rich repeat domain-containing protein [Treponema sp.]|jgi:hypothetical protein|nr:leucine-rich repeat domain-containing protein [Treponema sp.]
MKLPGYLSGILLICLTLGACDSYNLSLQEFFNGPPPGDSATVRLGSVAGLLTYLAAATGGDSIDNPIVLPPLELNLTANEMTLLLAAIQSSGKYVSIDLSTCTMPSPEFDPGTTNTGKQYITALILPDAATSIKSGIYPDYNPTFRYFDKLSSVSGAGITQVGVVAFDTCTSLSTISFPKAAVIGNSAFFRCTSLTSVNLPKAATIDNSAFHECTSLTTISLPEAATIGKDVFNGCTSLATINLPEASNIGNNAFNGCTSLATISLPKATGIGDRAFEGCTVLTTISLPKVTTIGNNAFNGCTSLSTISLSEVTTIDDSTFNGCSSLTSVNLPKVTTIGDGAFDGCTSLATISLPEASTIGDYVFSDCTNLTSVNFPEVTSIGDYAFTRCTALASLTLGKDTAPWPELGSTPFYNTGNSDTLTIHVPAGTAANYTSAWGVSAATLAGGNENKYGNNHKAIEIID